MELFFILIVDLRLLCWHFFQNWVLNEAANSDTFQHEHDLFYCSKWSTTFLATKGKFTSDSPLGRRSNSRNFGSPLFPNPAESSILKLVPSVGLSLPRATDGSTSMFSAYLNLHHLGVYIIFKDGKKNHTSFFNNFIIFLFYVIQNQWTSNNFIHIYQKIYYKKKIRWKCINVINPGWSLFAHSRLHSKTHFLLAPSSPCFGFTSTFLFLFTSLVLQHTSGTVPLLVGWLRRYIYTHPET